MSLAEDVLNEFREPIAEEEYQQLAQQAPQDHQEEPREEVPEDIEEEKELEDNSGGIKQIVVMLVSITLLYTVIIQYKLVDKFLEMYMPDTPIGIKRIGVFCLATAVIFIILKLQE